jgi:AbiJ N-terminal domain 4
MPFSERMGYRQKQLIQIEAMDDELRNGLFNVARTFLLVGLAEFTIRHRQIWVQRFNNAWSLFFKRPLHTSPARYAGDKEPNDFIYKFFNGAEWHRIYDFVEFLVDQSGGSLTAEFNKVLEQEVAGYRILEGIVVPISDAAQIDAIRSGLEASTTDPLGGVHEHLASSLRLLSDRNKPDYRNSIKEAISAIESAASVLTCASKAELKDALRFLEGKGRLHPALREAFVKLYGWTSDEDGVRHALMEESSLDFADAQFMLVVCSAFVHYLVAKAVD